MKKLLFALFCLIALTTVTNAQNAQKAKKTTMLHTTDIEPQPQSHQALIKDNEVIVEQQFVRELNGIEYRVVIKEHPMNPSRNTVFIYRHQPTSIEGQLPVSFLCFSLAPKFDNFRVMPVDGISDKMVILYSYNGETKQIEFK